MNWFQALTYALENPALIKHLRTHAEWYTRVNWEPKHFLDLESIKRDLKYSEDDCSRMRNNIYLTNKGYEERLKKQDVEIIHLKDLIQAKDLVITKLISPSE